MRIIILNLIVLFLSLISHQLTAQEIPQNTENTKEDSLINQNKIEELEAERDRLIIVEKNKLKAKVSEIETKLAREEITKAEAEEQKMQFATIAAENIENRSAIIDNQIELLKRNQSVNLKNDSYSLVFGADGKGLFGFSLKPNDDAKIDTTFHDDRTTSSLVIAAGFNNAIIEGQSLEDSPYKKGGSRFFEIGWAWKTRVFENTNWLRFKYGFSFQFNGLKMEDNQYYVERGDQTVLQTFPQDLDKSKIRFDHLVLPLHFELGTSDKEGEGDKIEYHTGGKFKLGLGGYAGLRLKTIQKLKYEEDGNDRKDKFKQRYNTNDFIYGLSAYVGAGSTSLYVKYDLNTIFEDNPVDQRNISLGVRFDL